MTDGNPLHFPEICHVGQRIAKTMFAENGPLTPTDRRLFKTKVSEVICSYILKPDNAGLNAWADDQWEYDSLVVLDILLRQTTHAERIAELLHRSMPYPLLLQFHDATDRLMFSMADKRLSRDGREQVVLEYQIQTPWRTAAELTDFFQVADYTNFHKTNFHDLFLYYQELLEALRAAAITGKLCVTGIDPQARRQALAHLHQLYIKLAALKAQARKETALSKLVELNLDAQGIKQEIAENTALLMAPKQN